MVYLLKSSIASQLFTPSCVSLSHVADTDKRFKVSFNHKVIQLKKNTSRIQMVHCQNIWWNITSFTFRLNLAFHITKSSKDRLYWIPLITNKDKLICQSTETSLTEQNVLTCRHCTNIYDGINSNFTVIPRLKRKISFMNSRDASLTSTLL